MNFFEHQDRARRQSRWLVVLFALAVLAIIAAVNLAIFFAVGPQIDTMMMASAVTGGVIVVASLYRTLQLRGGGGEIAQMMGGTLIESDSSDPLRRRLRNVVEEMAIASGVPVPEIYVLEHEQGINAFAAGYTASDAAVAVTRGALEHLDREELQGVIAHEFSHILNGDTRLNVRLIGVLFGILVIAIAGRHLLFSVRHARDSRNAGPAVIIGLAVLIVGYIGLFFARWIRAGVSRQREYLADASAVQFTRLPDGIGGALKKIGAVHGGSSLMVDSEEVGHMLFASDLRARMFATHPPLEDRIRAVDPAFKPEELERIRERLDRHAQSRRAEAEAAAAGEAEPAAAADGPGGLALDPGRLAEQIGQPGLDQVLAAALLVRGLPEPLTHAAHSDEWATELMCTLLLHPDDDIREQQLLLISNHLGHDSEQQVRVLAEPVAALEPGRRLPLAEMAFPVLRRRPDADLAALDELLDELLEATGTPRMFDYALSRLLRRQIGEARRPERGGPGSARLRARRRAAAFVLAVLARQGHPERPEAAGRAFTAGLEALSLDPVTLPELPGDWPHTLDQALDALDHLRPADKQRLIQALTVCLMSDGRIQPAELDLLRVTCGLLHVPLPLMTPESESD